MSLRKHKEGRPEQRQQTGPGRVCCYTPGTLTSRLIRPVRLINLDLWPAHARHLGQVAVGLAADVVFKTDISAQIVDEARLPISAVILRIVNGDDVFELRRADPADALDRSHLVRMRRAGGIDESLFVEARGVDHQRIALEVTDRVTVVEREGGLLPRRGHRL